MKKTGVICMNIGTPDAPKTREVRKYLRQFLSDPRVIDIPWLARNLLLYLFILPFRPRKSAEAYKSVWKKQGSPLLIESKAYKEALQRELGESYQVELGMRYGEPSIDKAIEKLKHCQSIILFPQFPQYASSSTGSSLEYALKVLGKQWNVPSIRVIPPFFQEDGFILSVTSIMEKYRSAHDYDHVLLSYHGLPERQIEKK